MPSGGVGVESAVDPDLAEVTWRPKFTWMSCPSLLVARVQTQAVLEVTVEGAVDVGVVGVARAFGQSRGRR